MGAWGKTTLGRVLEEVSQRYPENAALIFKDQRISYGELLEKARALAKGLIALGVGRGGRGGDLRPGMAHHERLL